MASAALLGASLTLHGCGGGGDTTSPAASPGSRTTTPASGTVTTTVPASGAATTTVPASGTATTTVPASETATTTVPATGTTAAATTTAATTGAATTFTPSEPGDPAEIARWMNELYTGFSPDDDTSPLGVTIMMHHEFVVHCGVECYHGEADCRTSSSVYNHLVQVTAEGNSIAITMDRLSGVVFNQSLIQESLTKCSYMFDGATFGRLNGGCGCGALGHTCDDANCAYNNIDPDTGETVTGDSAHVQRCYCDGGVLHPDKTTDEQCFWKGPSFYRPDGVHGDETRQMLVQRLAHQDGTEQRSPTEIVQKSEFWNEVVLDGNVLQEQLALDPARVVPAFVYLKGSTGGRHTAQNMASKFASDYGFANPPPLIAIDVTVDVSQQLPFSVEEEDGAALYV